MITPSGEVSLIFSFFGGAGGLSLIMLLACDALYVSVVLLVVALLGVARHTVNKIIIVVL